EINRVDRCSTLRRSGQRDKTGTLGQWISTCQSDRNSIGVLVSQEASLARLRNNTPRRANARTKHIVRYHLIPKHFLRENRRARRYQVVGIVDRVNIVDQRLGNDEEGLVIATWLDNTADLEQTSGNAGLDLWRAIKDLGNTATSNIQRGRSDVATLLCQE